MVEFADVVTVGEVMAMFAATDHRPLHHVDHFEHRLAGAEMNVSVGLARLGHRVRYLGAVGADPFGTRVREVLRAESVDVDGLRVDPLAPTGFQLKNRVRSGDPTVVYFRSGSAASRYTWSQAVEESIRSARHLHVTGIFPALNAGTRECTFRAIATARAAGATVSFDPNLRPSLWTDSTEMITVINELAMSADWVLPGLDEGRTLTGSDGPAEIADFYLRAGVSRVVVKLGDRGATLCSPEHTWWEPALPVHVVDTVGAGDGFAAGWISARLEGLDEQQALHRACAVAAIATTSEGDMDGLPSRGCLSDVLEGKSVA